MQFEQPRLISIPFANEGSKNVIPDPEYSDPSINNATMQKGFPNITMVPEQAGGKPPQGQDFNGILNLITEHLKFYSSGGQFRFDATFASLIGGYPKGSVLQNDTGEITYISLVDNNTENFNTSESILNWRVFGGDIEIGTKNGQVPIWNQTIGKWEPGFISGKKLGELVFLPYDEDETTLGLFQISYNQNTPLPINAYPDADIAKLACPSVYNNTADFFYRCDNEDGSGRNVSGNILMLPAAAKYFFRGFDPNGGAEQYQYQDWAIENISGGLGYVRGNGLQGIAASGAFSYTNLGDGLSVVTNQNGEPFYSFDFNAARVVKASNETRPMNISAFRVFMKIYDSATAPVGMNVDELVKSFNSMAGLKLNRSEAYGIDQNWVDVTSERVVNTFYLAPDYPIHLYAAARSTSSIATTMSITIDGVDYFGPPSNDSSSIFSICMQIPAGSTYSFRPSNPNYTSLSVREQRK